MSPRSSGIMEERPKERRGHCISTRIVLIVGGQVDEVRSGEDVSDTDGIGKKEDVSFRGVWGLGE
jgi:hypothetical protein